MFSKTSFSKKEVGNCVTFLLKISFSFCVVLLCLCCDGCNSAGIFILLFNTVKIINFIEIKDWTVIFKLNNETIINFLHNGKVELDQWTQWTSPKDEFDMYVALPRPYKRGMHCILQYFILF